MSDRDPLISDRLAAARAALSPEDSQRFEPPAELWESLRDRAEPLRSGAPHTPQGSLDDDNVRSLGGRNRGSGPWRSPMLLSAAAVLVVLVLGGIAVATLLSGADETLVAEVALLNEGLPVTSTAMATATLVETDDGWILDIADLSAEDLPVTESAAFELWVINSDVSDMFSLGKFDGSGRYPLPAGVAPAEFPIVDISIEPDDGVAAHSGQSILRGVLET